MLHDISSVIRSIGVVGCLALSGLLPAQAAQADINISGSWDGKGNCAVLDQLDGMTPLKLKKEQIQLTMYEGAAAASGNSTFLEARLATLNFGTFYFHGFVFASSVEGKGKDSVVAYYMTDPASGCNSVGNQGSFYATVKKGRMKLHYVSSTSHNNFGTCTFKLKQTSTTAMPSPCP